LGSSETLVWIGTERPSAVNASRAPKTAALTSRMSWAVSMMMRSAPPWISPRACSSKTVTSSRNVILPSVGSSDRSGDEPVLADGLACDLGRLLVDLERVLAQAPLLELQARGLEAVSLHDLGAGVDHRRVQRLDDVGAVQDERLVTLALQPPVVGGRQVVLLQGRAHRAVEDDDALADGGQVVAHPLDATRTLTQPCQCSDA
jgi:hypothetical protein